MKYTLKLYLAFFFAFLGMMISLFYSEVLNFEPCQLCWYQRISLYSCAVILAISAFKGQSDVVPYVKVLLFIGCGFAFYQILIQERPGFNPIGFCGPNAKCHEKIDVGLGPISMPMLSFSNFLLIIFLLRKNRLQQ